MRTVRTFAIFGGAVILAALALALALAAIAPASAQSRVPAGLQKEYDQFITVFRAALKANDSAAVTAMTKFPFHWNEMRDAAYFRQTIYAKIFTPRIRKCLARGKGVHDRNPEGGDNFTLFCGEDLFLFTRTPEGFRFVETGMND